LAGKGAKEQADRGRVRIFGEGKKRHVELQFRDVEIAYEQSKVWRIWLAGSRQELAGVGLLSDRLLPENTLP